MSGADGLTGVDGPDQADGPARVDAETDSTAGPTDIAC
jgi:hypothetical protein